MVMACIDPRGASARSGAAGIFQATIQNEPELGISGNFGDVGNFGDAILNSAPEPEIRIKYGVPEITRNYEINEITKLYPPDITVIRRPQPPMRR